MNWGDKIKDQNKHLTLDGVHYGKLSIHTVQDHLSVSIIVDGVGTSVIGLSPDKINQLRDFLNTVGTKS
jgi:hypothetical protein